jgi:hypothetical protein
MTVTTPARAGQAELEAARLLLERMGITPDQLLQAATPRRPAPTFAEYIPVVEAAVGPGTRRVYGTYWYRLRDKWGQRPIDEPTPYRLGRWLRADLADPRRIVRAGSTTRQGRGKGSRPLLSPAAGSE